MFIHLHVHSYFSLGRGVASPRALCEAAKARGMDTLALTDTQGLYGLIWFLQAAQDTGIRPLLGAEVTLDDGLGPSGSKAAPAPMSFQDFERVSARAVLLAKNPTGYRSLCRILSALHRTDEAGKSSGRLKREAPFFLSRHLTQDRDGLIILSDSPPLLRAVAQAHGTEDLYVELQPGPRARALLDYAQKTGIAPVATNAVYFVDPEDYRVHQILRAIALRVTLKRIPPQELASPQSWLKSPAEMATSFPQAPQALENTLRIAEACQTEWDFGQVIFPAFRTPDEVDAFEYLKAQCSAGARRRYGAITPVIQERLERELALIREKGFASYFLVVQDIVKQFPRTCGRGSAAASLVAYCLGITDVDPVKYDLFFERFLNPGRSDPPDIDLDFPWDERDAVLEYIFQKYGTERTAMVSNHVCFQGRAAIREIARVYGLPEAEITRITERFAAYSPSNEPLDLIPSGPPFGDEPFHPPWPEIFRIAEQLHGIPRHLSVHCGGVVIVPDRIDHYVPIQKAPKGVNILQWEKDQAEEAGLVKIDILGNRSLAVIRDALAAIQRNYGVAIDYDRWPSGWNPLEDPKTQDLIRRGDTLGVFYVESPAMRLLQQKAKTGDFEHLVIHSSMIRPAANEYIREYVRRLHGGAYEPLHPRLEEILKETYGILCYQEDVSKVAMALAGFDVVDADRLRKILSKKDRAKKLEDYRQKFYAGCRANGLTGETIDKIWQMILSFSGYSFCKPHSASYALVSYQSAYLRAHYPAEFMAAVLSNQGGYYSTFAYISECRRMGLRVLLPEINASRREYTGRRREVRVGFMQLKGLQSTAIEAIVAERERRGPFRSFDDFLRRVDIPPSDVKRLIKAGAFDGIEPRRSRPQLMWQLLHWRGYTTFAGPDSRIPHPRSSQPHADFRLRTPRPAHQGTLPLFTETKISLPQPEPYDESTVLHHEMETLGFLISRHPLTLYREKLAKIPYVKARDLHRHVGRRVTTIGWYVTGKRVETKDDAPMEFTSFEDTTALYETVFFPQAYAKFCWMISATRPYVLRGKVEEDFGAITLTVEDLRFLA